MCIRDRISLELIFFELELMAVQPEIIDPIMQDPALENYRHFIQASRLFRDHRLPEPEERILEEKSNSGSRAFERLFEETVSSMEFQVVVEGEEKTLTEPEVLALLRDPNRETCLLYTSNWLCLSRGVSLQEAPVALCQLQI